MQIWDPILAITMSEPGLRFQTLWNLFLEANIFPSKFLWTFVLIFSSLFVRDVEIKTFPDQIWS